MLRGNNRARGTTPEDPVVDRGTKGTAHTRPESVVNLVKRVYVVTSQPRSDQHPFLEEYKDVFQGLGCLLGEHKIHGDETVAPVVHACRKVPFSLRKKLKDELAHMKKRDEPTDWVRSLVVLQKKN